MLEPGIKIVSINEDSNFNPDTAINSPVIRVTFRVDNHGPFVERFQKADYSALKRDAKLNDFAREVRS